MMLELFIQLTCLFSFVGGGLYRFAECAPAASDHTFTIDQGPYVSEYRRYCRSTYYKPLDARKFCTNLGTEWHSAHMAFKKGLDGFAAYVKTNSPANYAENTWFGITDEAAEGYWSYKGGRLDGVIFYTGQYNTANECFRWASGFNTTNLFCPWASKQPENAGANSADNGANYGVMWPEGAVFVTGDTYTSRTDIYCTACERTFCKNGHDCYAPNTANMTGVYFPNCACVCKPGAWGAKCEFPIIVDHGPYMSEYARKCDADAFGYGVVAGRCQSAFGSEWKVANFPSKSSHIAFWNRSLGLKTPFAEVWIAISDAATEGRWLYTESRASLANFWVGAIAGSCIRLGLTSYQTSVFHTYCPWTPGEQPENASPANAPGGAQCGVIAGTRQGAAVMADTWCTRDNTVSCYACERSPCRIEHDCYPPNTDGMAPNSYWPNCGCICKPGAYGDRCELPIVIDYGSYVSEYRHFIQDRPLVYSEGQTKCQQLGPEWNLASIPTRSAMQTFWGHIRGSTAVSSKVMWNGINDSVVEGRWTFSHGRLAGKHFWTGVYGSGKCQQWFYDSFEAHLAVEDCQWNYSQPENAYGSNPANCGAMWYDEYDQNFNNGDTYCLRADIDSYACERSRCRFEHDCYAPNTANMTGVYFPNCACVCKPGAWGEKCEFPIIVDHGPYMSEYARECAATGLTQSAAQTKCQQRGVGWNLATLPTALSSAAVLNQTRGLAPHRAPMWVAASDAATEGSWLWTYGRLSGVPFWEGGVCLNVSLGNDGRSSSSSSHCPWNTTNGWPSAATPSHDCGLAVIVSVNNASQRLELRLAETPCAVTTAASCMLCERSPCSIRLDCHPVGTESLVSGGYFPNCTCVCRRGWSGPKCERYRAVTASERLTATKSIENAATRTAEELATASLSPSITFFVSQSEGKTETYYSDAPRPPTPSPLLTSSRGLEDSRSMVFTASDALPATVSLSEESKELSLTKTVHQTAPSPPVTTETSRIHTATTTVVATTPVSHNVTQPVVTTVTEGTSSVAPSSSSDATSLTVEDEETTYATDASTSPSPSPPPYKPTIENVDYNNAPLASALLSMAAPEPQFIFIGPRGAEHGHWQCARLRLLLVPSALLSPIPPHALFGGTDTVDTFEGALAVSGIIAVAALVLGFLTFLGCWAVRATLWPSYHAVSQAKLLANGHTAPDGPAASARFPATFIQTVTFLSHGVAPAAALSLTRLIVNQNSVTDSDGLISFDGASSSSASIFSSEVVAIVSACIVCIVLPVAWIALVRARCPSERNVLTAKGWGNSSSSSGCVDKLHQFTKKEGEEGEDVSTIVKERTQETTRQSNTVFLCGSVRPRVHSQQLGPIVGDLRFQSLISPAIVCIVPAAVFMVIVITLAADNACRSAPFAAGLVYCCYAVAVVVSRPFLAIQHNAVEACASAIFGGCLISLTFVMPTSLSIISLSGNVHASGGVPSLHFSNAEIALCLTLTAISNCRYPFVLARALDVVLPAVVKVVKQKGEGTTQKKGDDEEKAVRISSAADVYDGAGGSGNDQPLLIPDEIASEDEQEKKKEKKGQSQRVQETNIESQTNRKEKEQQLVSPKDSSSPHGEEVAAGVEKSENLSDDLDL